MIGAIAFAFVTLCIIFMVIQILQFLSEPFVFLLRLIIRSSRLLNSVSVRRVMTSKEHDTLETMSPNRRHKKPKKNNKNSLVLKSTNATKATDKKMKYQML